MLLSPMKRMINAIDVVAASNAITGTISPELKIPTPLEASAATPICVQPSKAEALPMFFINGANASALAFGLIKPTQVRQTKNIPIVEYSPFHSFETQMRKRKLVITWQVRATRKMSALL